MSELETTSEFTGDAIWILIGVLCCLPYGVYYYFSNKETVWICPDCQETVKVGASTCKHCNEDLNQYQ
ncbi:hypothetical protein [Halopiger djelfimassiliensis]|uniref:hypothetical protein n=1 Tax=Halopiger djelfimassiliensis TaxID=1293047 RepID=UPI0006776825|nr:hypothetical protein [Halopiger djelfimassiliensis]